MESYRSWIGRWLATIEFLVRIVFWGIGYFFGFTLITMISVGTIFAEEFSYLARDQKKRHRFWVFKQEGRIYLVAEAVSALGWIFLATVVWITALVLTGVI